YLRGTALSVGQTRSPQTALCALAYWRLATGDVRAAREALRRMRRLATSTSEQLIQSIATCEAALEAHLATAEHRSSARDKLGQLDSLLRAGAHPPQLLIPIVANITAVRLHERHGDPEGALAAV